MQSSKLGIVCVVCATIAICCIAWAIAWGNTQAWKTITENGYEQRQMDGSTSTIWVKPNGEPVK